MKLMNCRDVVQLASDYLDRDLSRLTRLRIRVHVFMCVRCRRFVRQLKTVVRTVAAMADQDAPTSPSSAELDVLAQRLRRLHDET